MPSNNKLQNNRHAIDRVAESLADMIAKLASAGLVIMTLVICWQVFGRYVLNDSPPWSESVALLAMLYLVLLGAAVGVFEQFHLGFRFLVLKLPARFKRMVYVAGQLLVMLFGAAMAWNGMRLVDFTASHIIPTLGIPRSVAYWPFVLCGVLIVLFALFHCVVVIRDKGETDPWN